MDYEGKPFAPCLFVSYRRILTKLHAICTKWNASELFQRVTDSDSQVLSVNMMHMNLGHDIVLLQESTKEAYKDY